ncbi:MAG: ABC transporter substrate-binding protein [bacterium]|nr:ABC transporter substrate-binding protein [bacterium]
MTRKYLAFLGISLALLGCQKDKAIKISVITPITGSFEIYGQAVKKGVELAYEELRANPDLPFQLELTVVDSEGNPELAAAKLKEEFEAGAVAVIGGVMSDEALEMVAVADRYDRVLISPSASNPQLTGISKNFYRVFPSDSREGTKMGNFASAKLEMETAVIVAKSDTYARGIKEVFQAEFERNDGEVIEVIEYPAGADLSGLIDRVIALNPAGVYLAAFAEDIGMMISELRSKGYRNRILTTSAFAAPAAIEQTGEAGEGVFLTQAAFDASSEDPKIQAFVEAFRSKYGLNPDLYAAHGYDAVMVLVEAFKDGELVATEVWKKVRGLRDFTGVTGTIQFDERGDVQKFPRVYVVEDTNLKDYEKDIEERRRQLLERLRRLEEAQRRRNAG